MEDDEPQPQHPEEIVSSIRGCSRELNVATQTDRINDWQCFARNRHDDAFSSCSRATDDENELSTENSPPRYRRRRIRRTRMQRDIEIGMISNLPSPRPECSTSHNELPRSSPVIEVLTTDDHSSLSKNNQSSVSNDDGTPHRNRQTVIVFAERNDDNPPPSLQRSSIIPSSEEIESTPSQLWDVSSETLTAPSEEDLRLRANLLEKLARVNLCQLKYSPVHYDDRAEAEFLDRDDLILAVREEETDGRRVRLNVFYTANVKSIRRFFRLRRPRVTEFRVLQVKDTADVIRNLTEEQNRVLVRTCFTAEEIIALTALLD